MKGLLVVPLIALVSLTTSTSTIRVMTFNVWLCGTQVKQGLDKIAKHIKMIDPDVVALEVGLSTQKSLHSWNPGNRGHGLPRESPVSARSGMDGDSPQQRLPGYGCPNQMASCARNRVPNGLHDRPGHDLFRARR